MTTLNWEFDDQGEWEAHSSVIMDEDLPYTYRIQVCADGTFDVTGSDEQLGLKDRRTLGSFGGATATCEAREHELRRGR